jgi:hypothetical protein
LQAIEKEIIGLLAVNKEVRQMLIESGEKPRFGDADMQCAADLLWKYPGKGPVEIDNQNEQTEHFVRGIRQIKKAFGSGADYEDPVKALGDLLKHKKVVEQKMRVAELQGRLAELGEQPQLMAETLRELSDTRKEIEVFERSKKSAHAIED